MKEISKEAIDKIILGRQVAEIKLAKELWDLYESTPELIWAIRKLVKLGGDYVDSLWEHVDDKTVVQWDPRDEKSKKTTMQHLWDKELNILEAFAKEKDPKTGVETFGKNIAGLDPNKPGEEGTKWWDMGRLGSFLRGFGAFCEIVSGHLTAEQEEELKTLTENFAKLNDARGGWRSATADAFNPNKRQRTAPMLKVGSLNEAIKNELQKLSPGRDSTENDGERTGITLFQLKGTSVIKKYCGLFGLPIGADISGTTTDSVFGLFYLLDRAKLTEAVTAEDAQRIEALLPLILLTPLIQMVAQYHHSIADCACALSLNDIIDFKGGVYESLLPLDFDKVKSSKTVTNVAQDLYWHPKGSPADAVYEVLSKYTKANPLVLVYGDDEGTAPTGGYAMDFNDYQQWKYLARMGIANRATTPPPARLMELFKKREEGALETAEEEELQKIQEGQTATYLRLTELREKAVLWQKDPNQNAFTEEEQRELREMLTKVPLSEKDAVLDDATQYARDYRRFVDFGEDESKWPVGASRKTWLYPPLKDDRTSCYTKAQVDAIWSSAVLAIRRDPYFT